MARKPKSLKDQVSEGLKQQQQNADAAVTPERLLSALGTKRLTTQELCSKLKCSENGVMSGILAAQKAHYLLTLYGDRWSIERAPLSATEDVVYESRPDGTYLFGFSGDQHLCSKYSRLDVLNDLYDHFEREGVDRVFNTGNWIDGEARFNRHELLVHGMDNQLSYMAEEFPHRDGIVTYAVAGDDHEGWFAQREGVDIGERAAQTMRDMGRTDWVNLGYMECFVTLKHSVTGKSTKLLVSHPGGGSAYALSYTIQKIIESLDGGEKPAAGLWGHYHKMMFANIRNVYCIQTGTTQDQTSFMRKKRIDAHIGGGICKLTQDPETGAITRCSVEFFRYFNKGYYNHRWNHAGDVVLPDRVA